MDAHREERSAGEVEHRAPAERVQDRAVEQRLHHEVAQLDARHRLRVDEERTERVEDWLEEEPEQLGGGGAEEARLEARRDVDVERVVALVLVVLRVVLLEERRVRDAERHVREDAERAVQRRPARPERLVVRDLVDGERQRVVDDAPEGVAGDEEGEERGVSQQDGRHQLHSHHHHHLVLELAVWHHQLLHLRVLRCNQHSSSSTSAHHHQQACSHDGANIHFTS